VLRSAGAAVAGLNAIEERRSGKPTANAVAFRNPPPRMGLFPVIFTTDYTFHEARVRHATGPRQLEDDNGITDLVTRGDQLIQTVQNERHI
jgi:hypothetical protein